MLKEEPIPRTAYGRRILLDAPAPEEITPFVREQAELQQLIGKRAKTVTLHSPGGIVTVDGRRYHSETRGMINHRIWWEVLNNFNLGSQWRLDLETLARRPACPVKDKGDLSFLTRDGIAQMAVNLLPFFQNLVIKCGDKGVVVVMRISGENATGSAWAHELSNPVKGYIVAKGLHGKEIVVLKHFPAIPVEPEEVVSVTGAGDSLAGALCAALVRDPTTFHTPKKLDAAIHLAQRAAVLSLHSVRAISPLLGEESAKAQQ